MKVAINANPMCLECGRLLMLRPVGDGKRAFTETPADAQCTNHCLIENAGKKFLAPTFDLEELQG